MVYTAEQKKIIESDPNKNILVESDAGCGKTFCIVERVKFLVKNGVKQDSILVLAFNKAIASEIAKKLQHNNLYIVKIETLDSFVLSKILGIHNIKPLLNLSSRREEDKLEIQKFYTTFDNSKEIFINNFNQIRNKINFTHVFFDECQDMTKQKFHVLKLLKDNEIKIFAVGDKKQKINGFSERKITFSDVDDNAVWELFNKPNDIKLKLTTSFRTNNFLLKEINKIYSTNTTSNILDDNYLLSKIDDASIGNITNFYKRISEKYPNNSIKILCRKNKEVYTINSMLVDFEKDEISNVNVFVNNFMEKCLNKDGDYWNLNFKSTLDFYNGLPDDELKRELYNLVVTAGKAHERIFLTSKTGAKYRYMYLNAFGWDFSFKNKEEVKYYLIDHFLKISNTKLFFPATTIHKAKGMEWPIAILFFSKMRSINDEEENLFYVGCTMAKKGLIIAHINDPKNKILNENINKFSFSNINKNISIDSDDRQYLSLDAVTEIELNLDMGIHKATGYGNTLHLIIQKYVENDLKLKFDDMYHYCDNFLYQASFNEYKNSLRVAFDKITDLIQEKHKKGYKIFSEYKLYLSSDELGRVITAKIDLLYIKDDKIEIVDLKSSNMEGKINDGYIRQLIIYKQAILKQHNKTNINCNFYVFNKNTGKLRNVDI